MHDTTRYIMVGGFLGAGKTTTLARLAGHYRQQGLNVGIVTNDQASDLVDTHLLRGLGFAVEEVSGSCFCCNFHGLMNEIERLGQAGAPDVILAEPVGSCTDLVATVLRPIAQRWPGRFSIAPYAVLLKPAQGREILSGISGGGFSDSAAYIVRKQLEEADAIVINRVDVLPPEEVDALERLVRQEFPQTPILRFSAHTGAGMERLAEFLDQPGGFGRKLMDVDYDVYAAGEAELGWLNGRWTITSESPCPLDELLLDLVVQLQAALRIRRQEPAHLKVIGQADGCFGVANLIASTADAELSLPSRCSTRRFELIVNARVACDPVELETHVREAVLAVCQSRRAQAIDLETKRFRPDRPTPTFRMANALETTGN